MAYYLLLDNRNKKRFLEIPKIHNKGQKPRYKSSEAFSLEEIDNFTTMFNSESEMKEYLLAKNIIKENELDKDIIILKKYQNQYHKINHNIIYEQYKEYLNEKNITYKIRSRENDKDFLKELINYYYNINKTENVYNNAVKNTLADISAKIEGNIELNYNLTYYIEEFIKTTLYFQNDKLGYKALRNLAIFTCNYETKEALQKEKERLLSMKEEKNNFSLKDKYKPYGRTRKREIKEGEQYSLFSD